MTNFVKILNGVVVDTILLSEEDALSGVEFITLCNIDGMWIASEAGMGCLYNSQTGVFSTPQRIKEDVLADVDSSSVQPAHLYPNEPVPPVF